MTVGKRRVLHRGTATKVLSVLSGRPGLITTGDEIATQLGKGVTAADVSSAVSYLRIHKHAPIEKVGNGAYRWTETRSLADAHNELTKTTQPSLPGIPRGGIQREIDEAVLNVGRHGHTQVSEDEFMIVKRTKDLIIFQELVDDSIWIARKI